jgi:hypothetical protein
MISLQGQKSTRFLIAKTLALIKYACTCGLGDIFLEIANEKENPFITKFQCSSVAKLLEQLAGMWKVLGSVF